MNIDSLLQHIAAYLVALEAECTGTEYILKSIIHPVQWHFLTIKKSSLVKMNMVMKRN